MVVAQKYHILKYSNNVEWLLYHNVRFIWTFRCNKCNKTFNYLPFQKHKELFKKTLIAINGDAEEAAMLQELRDAEEAARLQALQVCRSFSSNNGQCYSFGENLNGISGFSQNGGRVSRL